ncbi:hypothetical protein RPN21_20725 [Klebsiella aerogenes]|uniref:BapA/Bap/LapF family prefix-like domain-containing protein n=1 Tax=Klebsiella aerogenes TaxID=548 RepID=UPI0028A51B76|nr:hypothetical protein [Klebsiella aerogenes]MDT4310874.1 hypothetical protein [Klebsiella aerogenes]
MNGTIDFFSLSGEKIASAVGMTEAAPVESGAIRLPVSARDVTGVQKDKNTLNILLKDNQKIVIKDFFGDKKKKLVFDDGKEIFEADYLDKEQFNGLQFKPLQSIDEVFEGAEPAEDDNSDYVWVVPVIAAAAIGGIAIAAINDNDGGSKSSNKAKDKLEEAKDDAHKAIDDMDHLSDEQKDAAHQAVDDATDVPGVEKAQADAASLNADQEPSFLEGLISSIWNAIIAIPKGLLEALKSIIPKLSDYHFLLESAPAALTGIALVVWEALVEVIHVPLSFISNMVQWITGFTTGILGGIWGPLGTIPQIFNGILIILDGLGNGLKAIIESIGVGIITIPAIITGAIAWVITLVKGIGALLSGDSSAMDDFISDLSQTALQNPLIPLALGDLFVAFMAIPKLAVEVIAVIAEWILGIITGVMQWIPGLIPIAGVLSDFTLAIDGVAIAIHYGLDNVINLITKLGMALIMGIPIAISTGTSAITIIEAFIKGVLGISSDDNNSDNPINKFIDSIIDFISSPISGIEKIISSVFSSIENFIKDPLGTIGEIFQKVIDVILAPCKFIIDAVGSIIDFIASPLEGIGNIISNVMDCIGKFLSDPFGAIGDLFQNVIDIILAPCKFFIDAIGSIFNFVTNPIESISKVIGDPMTLMLKLISDPVGTMTELFNKVIDTIFGPFKGIIDFIGKVIYEVTHPLETLSNIINDIIAKIFGHSSNENTVASSLHSMTEAVEKVVETAVETVKPAAEKIDDILTSAEKTVDHILDESVGEGSEKNLSADDLAEITNTLDEISTYADTNVVSLNEMAEGQPSQESVTPESNEELTDQQLASIMEENNASEIDLNALVGKESNPDVAENNTPDELNSVEDTGGYNIQEQIITQLQQYEENYQLTAA